MTENKRKINIFKKFLITFAICCLAVSSIQFAAAKIIFQDDGFNDFESPYLLLDANNNDGNLSGIQFGNDNNPLNNGVINWDKALQLFKVNQNISFQQKQLKDVVIENLSLPPVPALPGQIYYNTIDNNTYVYNGTTWEDITALLSTASKVVTAGPGLDYANISDAAGYLNSLSGGIILLSAGTHVISTQINLANITLIGKGSDRTIIQMAGSGQIDSFDTTFSNLSLDINAITDDMAIDIQNGSNSLIFDRVAFSIQDATDSLIDSNAGVAPTVSLRFIKTDQDNLPGAILKTKAASNINVNSAIFVDGRSGDGVLKLNDWNVTVAEAGNVLTSGVISAIPNLSIYLTPSMNLQGAIDSLEAAGNGGLITLLPGIYNISTPLTVNDSDIQITGYGDATIIRANGFSGITNTTAAIQVGVAAGNAPVNGTVLKDFKLEVNGNFHGIRVTGGDDNKVDNVTVQKVTGQGGSGATAVIGIQYLDSTVGQLTRAVIQNSRVIGNGGTNYFTDGIHVTTNGSVSGTWGFGLGASNVLVEGNNVDYVRETSYVFVGVNDSSLFNNRASRMGAGGSGAYGIFMGRLANINMNANVFAGSLSNSAIAIGVDSFAVGSTTTDSIFNNNVIDGSSNGVGFAKGFELGSGNSRVIRSTFSNNTIKGSSNAANTVAIEVRGDSDDNSFNDNAITGGANNWSRGIDLQSNTQDRNIIRNNRYNQVITQETDAATATRFGVDQKRATVNPTATDDIQDGYSNGTIWLNTTTDAAFILADSTTNAAVWKEMTSNTAKVAQIYNNNGSPNNLNQTTWTTIPWNQQTVVDSTFSHNTVTNNSRLTVLENGLYEISYSIHQVTTANSLRNIRCGIRINGTLNTTPPGTIGDSTSTSNNTTNEIATNTATGMIQMNANDYFEVICRQEGSNGTSNLSNGSAQGISWTSIKKIR